MSFYAGTPLENSTKTPITTAIPRSIAIRGLNYIGWLLEVEAIKRRILLLAEVIWCRVGATDNIRVFNRSNRLQPCRRPINAGRVVLGEATPSFHR